MSDLDEMPRIKARIAQVYVQREAAKRDLAAGAVPPRAGLARLEELDVELSGLDSRYKALWDAAHLRASHPAADWARQTEYTPEQLDCVTAIMLKILDGKCQMGEADRTALTAIYDVIKAQPGQLLGEDIRTLIAQVRQDGGQTETIHAQRLHAEASIPKPVMKGFKQWLRAHMPVN